MNVCFYCGGIVTHLSVAGRQAAPHRQRTRDHKTPKVRGGTSEVGNVVTSCLKCNQDKGALTLEEYRLVCAHRRGLVKSCENLFSFDGELNTHLHKAS